MNVRKLENSGGNPNPLQVRGWAPRPEGGAGAGAAGAKVPRGGRGGRAGGGVRDGDASAIQTSGACSAPSGGGTDGGCTGRVCGADARAGAAMVKISFQPAVAGIKGDKADKAAAAASAPAPAAEILLTPARVRGAGDSGGRRGTEARSAGPRDPEAP
jgi:hypothetical protein